MRCHFQDVFSMYVEVVQGPSGLVSREPDEQKEESRDFDQNCRSEREGRPWLGQLCLEEGEILQVLSREGRSLVPVPSDMSESIITRWNNRHRLIRRRSSVEMF